jgi:hypothetical protein
LNDVLLPCKSLVCFSWIHCPSLLLCPGHLWTHVDLHPVHKGACTHTDIYTFVVLNKSIYEVCFNLFLFTLRMSQNIIFEQAYVCQLTVRLLFYYLHSFIVHNK